MCFELIIPAWLYGVVPFVTITAVAWYATRFKSAYKIQETGGKVKRIR